VTRRKGSTNRFEDVAEHVLRRADKAGKRHGARAVEVWPEVVGAEIARRTRGFALREDAELVVFVDSAPWAHQLSLMADDLLERMNAHLGEKAVKSIRFTVSRRAKEGFAWDAQEPILEAAEPTDEPIEPLDEIELQQVRHVASPIKDSALREVVMRVMAKDLGQKKSARQKGPRQPS
jgi:hypothetical protein